MNPNASKVDIALPFWNSQSFTQSGGGSPLRQSEKAISTVSTLVGSLIILNIKALGANCQTKTAKE